MDHNVMIIDGEGNFSSVGFLTHHNARPGETVQAGQIIGYTGSNAPSFSHLGPPPTSPTPNILLGKTPQVFEPPFTELDNASG